MSKAARFLCIFSVLTLICAAVYPLLPQRSDEEIYDNIVRLHVIANSDSDEDQALKLEVRDVVLAEVSHLISGCATETEAAEIIGANLDTVKAAASDYLLSTGRSCAVRCEFGEEYYPTRDYDGVSLPCGTYNSLRVCLGKAEGHNWWCVLFPNLCLDSSKPREKLAAAGFTPDQIRLLTESEGGYKVKFRILELINELLGKPSED